MKIQPITNHYNSCNNQKNALSFNAYKPLGKVILTSGGIASSAIAAAFLDASKEDIIEVSTVQDNAEQSKHAYNKLMRLIAELKLKNEKPTDREKYKVGYVEPKKPKIEDIIYDDPTDDPDYLTKRIYCYSDMQ